MDWDKLRIFHAVADAGSLTHAGDKLNLSQSAVSRQIRGLEEQLNTNLFHRHARGLILTEQGELLFDATSAMAKRLDAAAARIRDSEEEVFGELRVTTTTGFGSIGYFVDGVALFDATDTFSYINSSGSDGSPLGGGRGDGVWNRDAYGSTGRKVLQVLALLGPGVAVKSGEHRGYVGLVDLKTGDLLWLNADGAMGGDVRKEDGSDKRVRQLLEDFPGSSIAAEEPAA
mgnify:CR=1 FL=1